MKIWDGYPELYGLFELFLIWGYNICTRDIGLQLYTCDVIFANTIVSIVNWIPLHLNKLQGLALKQEILRNVIFELGNEDLTFWLAKSNRNRMGLKKLGFW